MSLYWTLNLLSISIPLFVSFHPRIKLYKFWSSIFLAIFISLIPFVIWDIHFTESGYWGFNPAYLSGQYFFGLPMEEWFFFMAIPYSCIFTHYSMIAIFPNVKLPLKLVKGVTISLLVLMMALGTFFHGYSYTLVDMVFGVIILSAAYYYNQALLQKYYLTFMIMLIPFFLINGILTGTGIENEIVWYNDVENMNIRLGTIPVEDIFYAFSLILLNLMLFEKLRSSKQKKGESFNSPSLS